MKAHKYWSLGALATMIGTFYTGYKNNDIEKAQSLNSLSFSLVYRSFVHSFSFLIFYAPHPPYNTKPFFRGGGPRWCSPPPPPMYKRENRNHHG